jgi:hypothetical protein
VSLVVIFFAQLGLTYSVFLSMRRANGITVAQVAEAKKDKKSVQKGHITGVDAQTSALCAHPVVLLCHTHDLP